MRKIKPTNLLMVFLFTLLFPGFTNKVAAQATKQKFTFSSVNEVGLLTGESGQALALQTTNGIQKGKSFAGIGVGFDFYGLRSIPLFASYRRALTSNKNPPFMYTNAGLNFLWLSTEQKNEMQAPDASSGYYYDLGLGWKLMGKNGAALVVSAGYTVKQVNYQLPSYTIFASPQIGGQSFDRFSFLYRRVVIKIGFQL
jgi:hypothetical protein